MRQKVLPLSAADFASGKPGWFARMRSSLFCNRFVVALHYRDLYAEKNLLEHGDVSYLSQLIAANRIIQGVYACVRLW